jgi:hypothetical protein
VFLRPYEEKVTGLGRFAWGPESFYEGEWKDGKPHGKGVKFWKENGTICHHLYLFFFFVLWQTMERNCTKMRLSLMAT